MCEKRIAALVLVKRGTVGKYSYKHEKATVYRHGAATSLDSFSNKGLSAKPTFQSYSV